MGGSNDGFVPAPNDCMVFDFAEKYKSKHFFMYKKGRLPPVALIGDALMEPFWPEGMGLKRGWNTVMDCTFAIDNLDIMPENELKLLMDRCYDLVQYVQMADEVRQGEYNDNNNLVIQYRKLLAT